MNTANVQSIIVAAVLAAAIMLWLPCSAVCQENTNRRDDLGRPVDLRLQTPEDPVYINVMSEEFRPANVSFRGGYLGYANLLPLGIEELPDSFGKGKKLYIFRNRSPFYLGRDGEISFTVRIGNTTEMYIWPETVPDRARWRITVTQLIGGAQNNVIRSGNFESYEFGFIRVIPNTDVLVSVRLNMPGANLARRLWLNMSPELPLLSDEKHVTTQFSSMFQYD